MQALLDQWVVGASIAPQQRGDEQRSRLVGEQTWLGMLGENALVKDTWVGKALVREGARMGPASADTGGSQTARAGEAGREAARAHRSGGSRASDERIHNGHSHRSGALTERNNEGRERRGALDRHQAGGSTTTSQPDSPQRGGDDLVEHLLNLEMSLRSQGSEPRSDSHRRQQQDREHGISPAKVRTPSTPMLAFRLATPRDRDGSAIATPRGPPMSVGARASPRVPISSARSTPRGAVSRAGGVLQGFNLYSNTDDSETSSESEGGDEGQGETDASTSSFVSNGERVWRAPTATFSKRSDEKKARSSGKKKQSSNDPEQGVHSRSAKTEGKVGARSSSAKSNRSSPGPDIPRLNFGSLGNVFQQEKPPPSPEKSRDSSGNSSRPDTPLDKTGTGTPLNMTAHSPEPSKSTPKPPEPKPTAMQHQTLKPPNVSAVARPLSLPGSKLQSQSQIVTGNVANSALMKMFEDLRVEYEALKVQYQRTNEENERLRAMGSNAGTGTDSACAACTAHKREADAARLELARERTRRRGLQQENERMEQKLMRATSGKEQKATPRDLVPLSDRPSSGSWT